ncbi:MAG: hypothetical protein N2749_01790 [Clostridia bacterium]|nr:hypothetical protein [Clostridia bacterium]
MRNIFLLSICYFFTQSVEASINTEGFVSLSGGKSYFDGDSSSLNLNSDIFLSPVINIDEENIIYPVYSGYYRGVQDLKELAGGDVLVRKRMGHSISIKYVKSKDFNHTKPRLSYSMDYIKETKDESWGKGLFDYKTISIGVEFEQERPNATYTQSIDFFDVNYPNYSSLISKYSSIIDTTTYSELSKNAGKDVLNSRNLRFGFTLTKFPKNINVIYSFAFTYRNFYDQSVVNEYGYFKSDKRRDLLTEFGIDLVRSSKKINTGLNFNFCYLMSNQNSYDASKTKYIDNYYDYFLFSITPSLKVNFKNNGSFNYSFSYERLNYIDRLSQDANGNYLNSKIYQNFYVNNLTIKYPIKKDLMTFFSYSYQIVDSNTKYEATYRYNYTSGNLSLGFELLF